MSDFSPNKENNSSLDAIT